MQTNKIKYILLCFFLAILFNGCTETFPLVTNTYEEALVVEATLTNELKNQEIKLTKTSKFESTGITTEKGAKVIVKDDQNNEYIFEEKPDRYLSQTVFQVLPDREYTLEITTTDGKVYNSTPEILTKVNPIGSVVPSLVTNKDNITGIQINVNSYDAQRESQYYRYEYEETYKIVTPRWSSLKAVITGPETIAVVANDVNTKTCYTTKNSTDIILVNTNDQAEDRVNLPIRFIEEDNYIIGHRYTILVKQYIENFQAYSFHKTMRDIASSASILSPKQPGVISGNIKCTTDLSTKVIGYFDVTSVSEQRIFLNYNDFFPNKPAPYFDPCFDIPYLFCFVQDGCNGESMMFDLDLKKITYIRNQGADYTMVNSVCGDCTLFSSNIIPSFWIN